MGNAGGRPPVDVVIGARHGRWEVLEELPGRPKRVRVRCACGAVLVRGWYALRDSTGGCPTCAGAARTLDLRGQRFGKLTVLVKTRMVKHQAHWRVRCDCGQERELSAGQLRSGNTNSCGCLKLRRTHEHHLWRGHGEISSSRWTHFRRSAEVRGLPFEMTIEDAWEMFLAQDRRCALSGVPISFVDHTASLDRVDNVRGYTKGNTQWLHKNVNMGKRDIPQETFIQMCRDVAAKFPKQDG